MDNKNFKFEVDRKEMTIDDYFETVKTRTSYYDIKAEKFKREYYFYSVVTVGISSAVSILTLLDGVTFFSITAAILSGLASILQTWVKIRRCYYKMINYRHFCDYLRCEQRLYAMKVDKYSSEDRDQKFVEYCEGIIKQEETAWKNTFEKKDN